LSWQYREPNGCNVYVETKRSILLERCTEITSLNPELKIHSSVVLHAVGNGDSRILISEKYIL
jgi:hypothetical protein